MEVITFNLNFSCLSLHKRKNIKKTLQIYSVFPDTKDFAERLSIISGWGRVAEKLPVSQVLRSVVVPIWSQEQCLKAGYGNSRITKNMMCAGYHDGGKIFIIF